MDLMFVVILICSHHSSMLSSLSEGFLNQKANLEALGNVGMDVDEVV